MFTNLSFSRDMLQIAISSNEALGKDPAPIVSDVPFAEGVLHGSHTFRLTTVSPFLMVNIDLLLI